MKIVEFFMGPMDGAVVEKTEELKKHFYAPIEGNTYHHYEMTCDGIYQYGGEVEVAVS